MAEMGRVNRRALAERIAKRSNRSFDEADLMVGLVLGEIGEALIKKNRITVTGFGSFEPVRRKRRRARNPQTGESVWIAENTALKFRPGAQLIRYLNGEERPKDRPLISKAPKGSLSPLRRGGEESDGAVEVP